MRVRDLRVASVAGTLDSTRRAGSRSRTGLRKGSVDMRSSSVTLRRLALQVAGVRSSTSWIDSRLLRKGPRNLRAAAITMRQVLVDSAREIYAGKRGGGMKPDTVSAAERVPAGSDDEVILVDEAPSRLQALNPRLAQVVECLFFAGYNEEKTAQALGISDRTVCGDWLKSKASLYVEMAPN